MTTEVEAAKGEIGAVKANSTTINVHVRYAGSKKPYIDPSASATETLGTLKKLAMDFFGVKEETGPQGTKVYKLAIGDKPLDDLSQTLGSVAEGKHELSLKLIEQFEQG